MFTLSCILFKSLGTEMKIVGLKEKKKTIN